MNERLRLALESCPPFVREVVSWCAQKHPELEDCLTKLAKRGCNLAREYCLLWRKDPRDYVLTMYVEVVRGMIKPSDGVALLETCPPQWELVEDLAREIAGMDPSEGYCWNFTSWQKGKLTIVRRDKPQCATGIVRTMRDDVKKSSKTCEACPYFVPIDDYREFLWLLLRGDFKEGMEIPLRRHVELYC